MRLELVQCRKKRVGCLEAIEHEEVFFITIVLSFVSIIVLYGRERGTCMEENRSLL